MPPVWGLSGALGRGVGGAPQSQGPCLAGGHCTGLWSRSGAPNRWAGASWAVMGLSWGAPGAVMGLSWALLGIWGPRSVGPLGPWAPKIGATSSGPPVRASQGPLKCLSGASGKFTFQFVAAPNLGHGFAGNVDILLARLPNYWALLRTAESLVSLARRGHQTACEKVMTVWSQQNLH